MKLTLFQAKETEAPVARFGIEELFIEAAKLGAIRVYQHTQLFTNIPADRWDVKIIMQRGNSKIEVERTDGTLNGALRLAIEEARRFA